MSTKTIVWIVIIILVVLGVWYFWSGQSASQGIPATSNSSQTSSGQTTGSPPQALSSGDTNADLDADLNTIDSQTSAANSDSASVDQSFNDQPIQQTQ